MSSLIQVSNSNAIVYISSTPFFGQLVTVRDISGKRSLSNTITVSTVGINFADGTFAKTIDTPYATITVDSSAKVVHQFPFTYSAPQDAQGLTTESYLTVTGPTRIYDSLFTYTSISSFGNIEANAIYVGDTVNSIATRSTLVSTVDGLGHFYTSSILIPIDSLQSNGYIIRSNLISTVDNLGKYYISVATLQSTIDGLATYKYVSTVSLASTVQSLSTSYIVNSNLASTIDGLGSFCYVSKADFLSTAADFRGGYIRDSSYQSTIAGLAATKYICTSQLGSTIDGLGLTYISSGSLISTTLGLMNSHLPGFSTLYVSSTQGVGQTYISSACLVSTVVGLTAWNASNLKSTVDGLGTSRYVSTSELTSTIAGLGQIYISTTVLYSTVGGLFNSNYTQSFISTVNTLGYGSNGYLSTTTMIPTASSIIGYEAVQMRSTVAGAGTPYLSTTQLFSTVGGLCNIYATIPVFLSTFDGESYYNTSNVVSTVQGLGSLKDPYISTTQLFSTVSNVLVIDSNLFFQTMTNLASASYFSTASLFSTVQGLCNIYATPFNLISTVAGIADFDTAVLVSTVCGLGSTTTYVSSTQLFSTVSNVTVIDDLLFYQTINTLGSAPYSYVSTTSLFSTVEGLSDIYIVGSNLTSSVGTIAAFNSDSLVSTMVGMGNSSYISTPQLLSTVSNVMDADQLYYSIVLPSLGSPPFNYISTVSLSSTIVGLNAATTSNGFNYIMTFNYVMGKHVASTIAQVKLDFDTSLLSTNRGLRYIGQPPDLGGPPVLGSEQSLFWAYEFMSSIVAINAIDANLYYTTTNKLGNIYVSTQSLNSTVDGLIAFSFLTVNNEVAQLASTMTGLKASNATVVGNYMNYLVSGGIILNTDFIATVSSVKGSNTAYHVNLVNTLGSSPYSYISTPSLVSTVQGLASLYATVSATASTVSNLSNYNASTLVSSVCGLGNSSYVSSTQLFSAVSTVSGLNLAATSSTIVGLGSSRYISTASMASTIQGIANTYISSPALVSNVSTYLGSQRYTNDQLTSSIANLGTKGYVSTASMLSTVAGLGSFYISTPQLVSTVVGLPNTYMNTTTIPATTASILAVLLVSTLVSTTVGLGSLGYISSQDNPDNYTVISKESAILKAATAQFIASLGSTPATAYSNFTIPKASSTTLFLYQSNAIVPSSNITVLGDGIQTADIYCTQRITASTDFRAKAFYCDGTKLNTSSDRRLKFDIVPLSNALPSLTDIKGTSYRLIDDPERKLLGFLAQDVELVYPELVFQYTEHKSIKYDSIGVILLEAIKELNCECDEMLASLSAPYNKGV